MDWVHTRVRKVCQDVAAAAGGAQNQNDDQIVNVNVYGRLRGEDGPSCPNCNESIINGTKIRLVKKEILQSPASNKESLKNSFIKELVQ